LLAGSVGGSVEGGCPQIHLPHVEGVVLGFVRRWGTVVDGLGVENIADGFGVVNMLVVGMPVVSFNGVVPGMIVDVKALVVPDSGAFVVPILGVVDLVSKYGRYPVG